MQKCCLGTVVFTVAQLHSTKSELKFCTSSNTSYGVSEICDSENLWQWFWLEIKINAFRRSIILQKHIITIIIIIITIKVSTHCQIIDLYVKIIVMIFLLLINILISFGMCSARKLSLSHYYDLHTKLSSKPLLICTCQHIPCKPHPSQCLVNHFVSKYL